MENNQKINCTVQSCRHHNNQTNMCNLCCINVAPKKGCGTRKADESLCSSYDCCH